MSDNCLNDQPGREDDLWSVSVDIGGENQIKSSHVIRGPFGSFTLWLNAYRRPPFLAYASPCRSMRFNFGIVALISAVVNGASPLYQPLFTPTRLSGLQNRTHALFLHAWNAYIDNALPADELRPLTCSPVGPDTTDKLHFGRNDVMGNFSLTVLDALDTLPIMGEQELFEQYVDFVRTNVSFDQPSIVQVFEVNIRVIGGLISAHLYASVPELGHAIPGYNGHLLAKAYDMAQRLLPAFATRRGVPYPRVHLQHGGVRIDGKKYSEITAAAAGSLLLEFAMLSRLTGDAVFEHVARKSAIATWNARSHLDLLGMALDAETLKWTQPYSTIGASVDSFYEYSLKYGLLFDDKQFVDMWETAYRAIMAFAKDAFYKVVHMDNGKLVSLWIDALSAFWPGLQVLWGRVDSAAETAIQYFKLWNNYGGIPERWTALGPGRGDIILEWYLLRPEYIESIYYLYQATRDPFYLQVGEGILDDLENINKVPCGVAAIQDIRTGELSDRMDSFFLSETVKYLYLLFSPEHPLNRESRNMVFSTEAHPMWSTASILGKAHAKNFDGLIASVPLHRPAQKVRIRALRELRSWSLKLRIPSTWRGKCQVPETPLNVSLVASSDSFYHLDWYAEFKPPEWLEREPDIEFHNGFYDMYVDPTATCSNPQAVKVNLA